MRRYFRSYESQEYSDQSQSNGVNSDSSSHSSLASQPSLPSIPSLTPPHENSTTTAAASSHHCAATLKGHSSSIFSLALAGKRLYWGDSGGAIRVWDRNTSSSHNYPVAESHSAVKSIAISGDKLFTAHHSHVIRVWKIDNSTAEKQSYKLIKTLPTLTDRCMRLLSGKNYVETRRHKRSTWIHHLDAVSALALTGDGSLLYSVSWDRTFKVWRISDFKCLESVQNAHDDAINAVVLSGDGLVYTGSADRRIKIWRKDYNDGEKKHSLVATLEKHKSAVNALALSDDGSVLYSGACDRSVIVWEKEGGGMAVAGALRGHTKAILCLATVADLLCSGSADRTVRIWRRERGKMNYSCLSVFEGHRNPVKCLSAALDCSDNGGGGGGGVSGNSYVVYSGGLDFEVKVWKIWVPFT